MLDMICIIKNNSNHFNYFHFSDFLFLILNLFFIPFWNAFSTWRPVWLVCFCLVWIDIKSQLSHALNKLHWENNLWTPLLKGHILSLQTCPIVTLTHVWVQACIRWHDSTWLNLSYLITYLLNVGDTHNQPQPLWENWFALQ